MPKRPTRTTSLTALKTEGWEVAEGLPHGLLDVDF